MSRILTPAAHTHRIKIWLARQLLPGDATDTDGTLRVSALAGDAGNRRYFRVCTGAKNFIAVYDSSPAQWQKFVRVRQQLADAGVRVPSLIAQHRRERFLLLEDFGDTTYRQRLHTHPRNTQALYRNAIATLLCIQRANVSTNTLPLYNRRRLISEMNLYPSRYLQQHRRHAFTAAERRVWTQATEFLQHTMQRQTQVMVHRDYHSRNLMHTGCGNHRPGVLDFQTAGGDQPGVLDFQDAVIGSVAYDCVSLLKDAYIAHPLTRQHKLLHHYWQTAKEAGIAVPKSFDELMLWFNTTGAQRGLKVVGIFCRLALRDGKKQYLNDIPLAYRHLQDSCRAIPQLKDLATLIEDHRPKEKTKCVR